MKTSTPSLSVVDMKSLALEGLRISVYLSKECYEVGA
jgi:hypothetical protein